MIQKLFFDERDHELIRVVNSIYDPDRNLNYTRKLYYPFFHPLGIKELAESKGLRTAYSIVNLLESMERGEIENRLQALKCLKDDIFSAADGPMPKNTARVLLQIMKSFVRAKGDYPAQLQLAHDFRLAAFGKPRTIRKQLRRYHLLEMPEAWNQITFDDHVHDAHTSGRKSPTHLIMDAWIKGIRRLRVIYYHYIEPRFAAELIEAARIMEIDLRIGIELWARYRNRRISFIWVSRELPDVESFLCFLAEPHVVAFMEQGKAVLQFQKKYILRLLDEFNNSHLDDICRRFDVDMAPLTPEGFLTFIYPGQPSINHLGEYIHASVIKAIHKRITALHNKGKGVVFDPEKKIDDLAAKLEGFTVDTIVSTFLFPDQQLDTLHSLDFSNEAEVPPRLRFNFTDLLDNIEQLHHAYRITLNVGDLKPEDILEILYAGKGMISRLEIITLKNILSGSTDNIFSVNELQEAINSGSLLKLKQIVRNIIKTVDHGEYDDKSNRLEKLMEILYDISALKNMYAVRPLKTRIGSDSSGKTYQAYGMGFGAVNTLPPRARKEIRRSTGDRLILPVKIIMHKQLTLLYQEVAGPVARYVTSVLKYLPGVHQLISTQKTKWVVDAFVLDPKGKGNVVALGGKHKTRLSAADLGLQDTVQSKIRYSWKNLNSKLKNCLKIGIGFIPAFLCFFLTKDWWLLAGFGAVIWFSITGFRNILQSVLGGRGLRRSSVLKWNDYVSWDRLTDSLMYTGFSVPLLDYAVKTVLLDRTFGITMDTSPLLLYSVMAIVNGIYLSSHNALRGLPKVAVTGNFFRSILSIPVAIGLNALIGLAMAVAGTPMINEVLQKWAAIISKASSDFVAGIIEGTADRFYNMGLRKRDIGKTFSDLFDTYARLELLFPETESLNILEKPEKLLNSRNSEVRDLSVMIIISALDLFYFWMYLPRAKTVMLDMVSSLTPEEKIIFRQSQRLLGQEQYISRLFVDGILGRNFSRPLSFYLTAHGHYLKAVIKSFD